MKHFLTKLFNPYDYLAIRLKKSPKKLADMIANELYDSPDMKRYLSENIPEHRRKFEWVEYVSRFHRVTIEVSPNYWDELRPGYTNIYLFYKTIFGYTENKKNFWIETSKFKESLKNHLAQFIKESYDIVWHDYEKNSYKE